jgi:hypothetical protein
VGVINSPLPYLYKKIERHIYMNTIKIIGKTLQTIAITVLIVATLWVGGSWVEIICKNTQPNPTYSEHNILVRVIESGMERMENK